MWALVEDNEVSEVFPRPKAITIGRINILKTFLMFGLVKN